MSQLPPDHQDQRKQEPAQQKFHRKSQQLHPLQWYRRRTLKVKLALGSLLALLLVLVVVSLLTTGWPFSLPHKQAGVHITVAATYYVSPAGNDANERTVATPVDRKNERSLGNESFPPIVS